MRTSTERRVSVLVAAFWLCLGSAVLAQDAVPDEILSRTIFIRVGSEAGTAFTIDYHDKLYLVTARHVVAGVPESRATIQVRRADKWEDYHTVKTLYPSSSDVDIAVFETNEKVSKPFTITPAVGKGEGATMGQQLWFIGYPFGMGSLVNGKKGTVLPFIKRGSMSAFDGTNPDAVIVYIDGFNNPGFSGGPIVFWDFSTRTYKILGVVRGYREENAKVSVNGQEVDTNILVNSGILVGYSIKHALEAIDKGQEKQP